jgi:hypothetical protein
LTRSFLTRGVVDVDVFVVVVGGGGGVVVVVVV